MVLKYNEILLFGMKDLTWMDMKIRVLIYIYKYIYDIFWKKY